MSSKRRLYRSKKDKKISGVLGGLAEFLGMDPSIVRILFVLVFIFTGFMPMGLIYFIAIFVIPFDDEVTDS